MNFSIQEQNTSNKFTGLTFVILLHLFIAYVVITTRTTGTITPIPPPITVFKPEIQPIIEDMPTTEMTDVTPDKRIVVEPPTIIIDHAPIDDGLKAVTVVKRDNEFDQPPTGKLPTHTTVRVPAVVDPNACEKPDYPSAAVRDSLEGVTLLAFLIGIDGRVVSAKIDQSSGTTSLDNAALTGLSRCKFKPGTVDGKPEQSWTKIQYVWKLD